MKAMDLLSQKMHIILLIISHVHGPSDVIQLLPFMLNGIESHGDYGTCSQQLQSEVG